MGGKTQVGSVHIEHLIENDRAAYWIEIQRLSVLIQI